LEGQLRRVYAQYRRQPDDLAKNVFLANMRDRNEVLFYRLLADIAIGKLAVYIVAAGLHPRRVIPVVLDMGTDNLRLPNDEMYIGNRHARIRDQRYDDLVDAYVTAASKLFPRAMLHWEDFGAGNARRILKTYRSDVCTFNDDMQGTAAVVLAAAFARGAGHRRPDA